MQRYPKNEELPVEVGGVAIPQNQELINGFDLYIDGELVHLTREEATYIRAILNKLTKKLTKDLRRTIVEHKR